MNSNNPSFALQAKTYIDRLQNCFSEEMLLSIEKLSEDLLLAWRDNRQVFICGNGGSAANALHMANDFHYGIGACGPPPSIPGLRVEALTANTGVITCLANDIGYENIFSHQLEVKAKSGDLLLVLSGSGNSPNIVQALRTAKLLGVKSYAILAFGGGLCLELADSVIYFPIEDMQIAEDTQLIIGHICMQFLTTQKDHLNGA